MAGIIPQQERALTRDDPRLTVRGNHRIFCLAMNLTDALIRCADAYCEAKKLARPTVSGLILRDSRALDRVGGGGSITIRNFDRALQWFSDHWPADVAWPLGVTRPAPKVITPSEAA